MAMNPSTAAREHTPLRDLTLYSLLALLCVMAWDFSGLDYPVMQAMGDAQGFSWKDNWWLEAVLHTKARQLAGVVLLGLVLMVWWPRGWFRHLSRLQRIEIVMGVLWCLLCISSLKRISLTSCPWDLQDFGGPAVYVSHWRWGVADGGAGHCFPGGHASSALAFLALCLPWLTNATVADRRRGRALLIGVLVLGFILGMTQTVRGAHYPSHTLWTGLICWAVSVLNHWAFDTFSRRRQALAQP
ncbi:phosphatase PAP2 family protein [Limnohabitans sp. MMS-10A-160]|jgi:membrane-associated PAP2 superfamily phosphatase|uniref:phosphatase PAP2 family protein n=2 Tax=unclassified Limnohabitans TaxID=2626134 RepID=UPI001E3AEF36|nr:phosphatase PAP2 family protein [Limnohabitans sp. MMS-10A-160]